ncbi:ParB/Srx family N-terminal domain-containing protein [Lactococcus muris]|uniref:ParB/Srx family N-terminal domain-containing protein n=1 Tax=Lactococcus muris TaxID=2941330 RepID=UPI00230018F3
MKNNPVKEKFKQHLESYEFLSSSKIKFILNQITNIPKSFFDEENDWWNHYAINNSFGETLGTDWIFPSRISIPKLQKYLSLNKRNEIQVPLKEFIPQYSESNEQYLPSLTNILYTPSTEESASQGQPIIILKEFHGGLRVIDGNHRVSQAKEAKLENISAYFVNEEEIFEFHLFSSHYNEMTRKAFRIFVDEMNKYYGDTID